MLPTTVEPLQTAPWELFEGAFLIVGLLLAFAGYPLYKLGLWLAGFVVGLQVGLVVGPMAELAFLGSVSEVSLLLAGLVGLAGGGLALLLEWAVVLLGGFVVGDLLFALLLGVDPFDPISLLGGLVAGVVALKLYAGAIILVTAFVGSWFVAIATALDPPVGPEQPLATFWLVFLAGVAVQAGLFRLGVSPPDLSSSTGESRSSVTPARRRRCPDCGHLNGRGRTDCFACGSPL